MSRCGERALHPCMEHNAEICLGGGRDALYTQPQRSPNKRQAERIHRSQPPVATSLTGLLLAGKPLPAPECRNRLYLLQKQRPKRSIWECLVDRYIPKPQRALHQALGIGIRNRLPARPMGQDSSGKDGKENRPTRAKRQALNADRPDGKPILLLVE